MIYLDNSATTKISEEVYKSMEPYFKEIYGNPDSKFYDLATKAKKAVDTARKQVGSLFCCEESDVIFTSGATESLNTVLKGIDRKGVIITSNIEHEATLETCDYLNKQGQEIIYLNADSNSKIDFSKIYNMKPEDIKLISIIYVNNETGVIQDVEEISNYCYDKNIPLMLDATQAIGRIRINLDKLKGVSFLCFSGHKIYGPKGSGAIIRRKNIKNEYFEFEPLIHGGKQEFGKRAGTLNVPAIVGLGKACELANEVNIEALSKKTNYLINILEEKFKNNIEINFKKDLAPGILSVRFKGINNEVLLSKLSNYIAMSSGSACSNTNVSKTLLNCRKTEKEAMETIRISLSNYIEEKDLDIFKEL